MTAFSRMFVIERLYLAKVRHWKQIITHHSQYAPRNMKPLTSCAAWTIICCLAGGELHLAPRNFWSIEVMKIRESKQTCKKPLSTRKKWLFRCIVLLIVLLAFEATSFISLYLAARRYPMDTMAEITPERVEGFLKNAYDPDLGWVSKPNRGDENSIGARSRHEYTDLRRTISVYGDSYTHCDGVPVEDAWPTKLEEKLGIGVLNFGVPAYGTDQALLRLEKQYDRYPSQTVCLCIQVENINRIVNIFRGFYHAGFGMPKPRFILTEEKLELYNPFDSPEAVREILLAHPERLIAIAREHDHWFKRQQLFGEPWRISFPFSFQFAGRIPYLVDRLRIASTDISSHVRLYDPNTVGFRILKLIVERFMDFADENGFKGLVVILPTPRDVYRYAEHRELTYHVLNDFLKDEGIPFVDVIGPMSEVSDIPALFVGRKDHYSGEGGDLIADELLRFLQEQNAVPTADTGRGTPPS